MVRRAQIVVLLVALAVIWAPVMATANPGHERDFTDRIHAERATAGVPAYSEQADLAAVARRHAERMAAEGRLYHNPNLANEVEGWEAVGENVGRGPSVDEIHRAFMASPSHRAGILSTTFTQVGVGVAIAADGEIWVAQVFRKPAAAPAPAPAPAPTTTTTAPPPPPPATSPPAEGNVDAASARREQQPERADRARTEPRALAAPVTAPAPPVTEAPAPAAPAPVSTVAAAEVDLVALEAAFETEAVTTASPTPAVLSFGPSRQARELNRQNELAVQVAASLLVLVVAAQTRYVVGQAGGMRVLVRSPLRPGRVATATTLP